MMMRRKAPGKRIISKVGNATKSLCVIGRRKFASDKKEAILEFMDQASRSVYSGHYSPLFAYSNTSTGACALEYTQNTNVNPTADFTASTATSGSACVFAVNMANSQMVYNGTTNWWSKLPNPVTSVGTVQSQPFIINKYEAFIELTNTTNIMIEVRMYDYVCRNDLYTAATPSILQQWQDGLYYEAAGAVRVNTSHVDSTPYDSQLFTQYFKIVKVTKVTLYPGATHVHTHRHNVHRNFYPLRFVRTQGFIEGLSSGTIFSAVGQPVEATTGSAGAVTTGIVDLNVLVRYKAELAQKYTNKTVYAPATSQLYQATQATGTFKALIDNTYQWTTEIEGG